MSMRSWIRNVFARPTTRPIRRVPNRARLGLEALEDRTVPSTFMVTKTLDDGSAGTLRWAVAQANTNAGVADTIHFDSTVFSSAQTITLGGTQLTLTDTATTTITGPAAGVTVSGNSASRVFEVNSSASAALSGLTITGGKVTGAGAEGGGVRNSGTLTMTGCTVSGNFADHKGGGLANFSGSTATLTNCTVSGNTAVFQGGGLQNYGSLTLAKCTISGNSVTRSDGSSGGINTQGAATLIAVDTTISGNSALHSGGGMAANGTVSLTNCTISGNTAKFGGGINSYTANTTLTNCTVSGNTAISQGGGIIFNFGSLKLTNLTVSGNTAYSGGGIFHTVVGVLTVGNSIVSANTATTGPDIVGAINTDNGHNLFGAALSGTTSGTGNIYTDTPMLAPLGDYGGPTQTMPPLAGSPAINAGDNTLALAITTDQRGFVRIVGTVDIGATEVQTVAHMVAFVEAYVNNLVTSGALTSGQGEALILNLRNNNGDAGKVQAFLNQVTTFLSQDILTQEHADQLRYWGDILLFIVTR